MQAQMEEFELSKSEMEQQRKVEEEKRRAEEQEVERRRERAARAQPGNCGQDHPGTAARYFVTISNMAQCTCV